MNAFHAKGLADLLKNPEFKEEIENPRRELLLEHQTELQDGNYALQQQILERIDEQLEKEFAKHHCLF